MTSKLKCPICGGDIEYNDSYSTYDCKNNPSEHYASEEIWQALIQTKQDLERTRKTLDVAVDALKDCEKILKADRKDWEYLTADIALKQIEQITALEQKE